MVLRISKCLVQFKLRLSGPRMNIDPVIITCLGQLFLQSILSRPICSMEQERSHSLEGVPICISFSGLYIDRNFVKLDRLAVYQPQRAPVVTGS